MCDGVAVVAAVVVVDQAEVVGAPDAYPISSSSSSRNRLPLNTGNGTIFDRSNVSIVSASCLREIGEEDVQKVETTRGKHATHETDAALTCPKSSRAVASSSWWLSMSVPFGTTMSGFCNRSTSRIVPAPNGARDEIAPHQPQNSGKIV